MIAIEKNEATCLPIEAYLHLIRSCSSGSTLKIRSTVFPQNTKHKTQNQISKKHNKHENKSN